MDAAIRGFSVVAMIAGLFGLSRSGWAAPCDETIHEGVATYYDFADGSGVCGYPAETGNQIVVALNAPQLEVTAMCGACIHVWGPSGEATVLVVNGCPECEVGHLDLSPEAYAVIAEGYNGVPPITWQYVPCDVTGPIKYAYYSGSTTSWAWVQIRHHRHPIATFEARMADGSFVELERADWGYFMALDLPAGDQTYRVTDIYGQVLEDSGIAVLDEGEVEGQAQFPPCTGVASGGDGPGPAGTAGQDSVTSQGSDDGAGCDCATVPRAPARSASGLLLLVGLLLLRRSRR